MKEQVKHMQSRGISSAFIGENADIDSIIAKGTTEFR
jgi:hypothetical protein